MGSINRPSIFEVNLIYLVLGFSLLFFGYIVQSKEIYSGLLITEYIIILLPNLAYLKLRGYSLREVLRLNKITFKQLLFSILIVIFAYPIAVFLNLIVITILTNYTSFMPNTVPIPGSTKEFLLGLFVIALAPGICEEIMFRGTLMKAYNRLGAGKSIIITSILFGMFHFNLMNFIGPTFLGIILGILAYKTNSIIAPIVAHTLNNGIALTIAFTLGKISSNLDEVAKTTIGIPETTQMLISIISIGFLALLSLGILLTLLKNFPSNVNYQEYSDNFYVYANNYKNIKYAPVIIIFLTFLLLNIKLFFFTV